MAKCEYCKNELQKGCPCEHCGTLYSSTTAMYIYGQTLKDFSRSDVTLTEKYLIVRKVSATEGMGVMIASRGFGLIGGLIAALLSSLQKRTYAFYDLKELQKVIYPYYTEKLKKEIALKFINKDGSSFILRVDALSAKKIAKSFADMLASVGVMVEDGSAVTNTLYCEKPFVDKDTFGARICASAAPFIQLQKKQFAAPPIQDGIYGNRQQAMNNSLVSQTVRQPAYQATTAIGTTSQNAQATKTCQSCGYLSPSTAKFCRKCGSSLQ